jgi:hypothetical protein
VDRARLAVAARCRDCPLEPSGGTDDLNGESAFKLHSAPPNGDLADESESRSDRDARSLDMAPDHVNIQVLVDVVHGEHDA